MSIDSIPRSKSSRFSCAYLLFVHLLVKRNSFLEYTFHLFPYLLVQQIIDVFLYLQIYIDRHYMPEKSKELDLDIVHLLKIK